MSFEIVISLLAALGVGGILGAILNRRFQQQNQTSEHDVRIFNQSNEILAEQKMSDITRLHLLDNHSIVNDDFFLLTEWCTFFEKTGNQYLDKRIAKENKKLFYALDKLTDFIATNFFTRSEQNPHNKSKYLKPDWNSDGGDDPGSGKMKKYVEYSKELRSLTNTVIKQYSVYRLTVKRILKI